MSDFIMSTPRRVGVDPPVGSGGSFTGIHTDGKMGSKSEVKHLSVMNEWEACFLFPRALAFDFCYDLDL